MLQMMLLPAALYTAMLFVPGYLVLRCTRLSRPLAVCCAPIITTGLVAVLDELLAIAHIPGSPLTVYLPIVALPTGYLVWRHLRGGLGDERGPEVRLEAWMLPIFVLVGVAICNNLFVSELERQYSFDSVMQHFDVQNHLNMTRAFADSRRFSSRGVTLFLTEEDRAIMPFGRGSFYPAVWYSQCAMLMLCTGLSAAGAINVSLAVTLGIAYPLSTCAFASMVFGKDRWSVVFCSVTCLAFVMFPWCLLIFGPLYPNLVGFTLMGSCMTLCMMAFAPGLTLRERAIAWALALTALLGQAFLQPNTLFSMFVILVPFVAQCTYRAALARGFGRWKSLAAMGVFLVVCVAFWTACFVSPLFYDVIREFWNRFAYPWQEVINILTQTYTLFFFSEITAQVLLGVLVIIGFVRCAYDPDRHWIAVSYLIACYICYVDAVSLDHFWKRFVAGFWYTDAVRVASVAIVVAVILAGDGLGWIYQQVSHYLRRYNRRLERPTHHRLAACILAGCFLVLNFMPSFNWPGAHSELSDDIDRMRIEQHDWDSDTFRTTFGDYRKLLYEGYAHNVPIDEHERAFLQQVKDLVGDELVINNPYDGSTISYGIYHIRTYYRRSNGNGGETETPESALIRTSLTSIATDEAVQEAVRKVGARYVMVLDPRTSIWSFLTTRSDVKDGSYDGIALLTEDTPGFTEVLVSGACHLYEIDGM